MILHRVEHRDGRGPEVSGLLYVHYTHALDAILKGIERPEQEPEHISARSARDGLQHVVSPHHVFGCAGLDTLRLWFPSPTGCRAMGRAGGMLVTYTVPDEATLVAPTRVAFDRRLAIRLHAVPVSDVHGLLMTTASSRQIERY